MKLPDFVFETKTWRSGFKFVCGIDEVGRGCFAGPVFAGAIIFDKLKIRIMNNELRIKDIKINDSKKMTASQREKAAEWIKKNVIGWGVGLASVAQINKLGIVKATQIAFRKAIAAASFKLNAKGSNIEYLLIDAFYIPYVRGMQVPRKNARTSPALQDLRARQLAIVKGDTKSISIAAASILAKVERDKYMATLSKNPKYKKYGWEENKGYGTKKHQLAIKKHGTTKLHRKVFIETFLKD